MNFLNIESNIPLLICGLLRSTLDDNDEVIIDHLYNQGMSLAETATRLGETKSTIRHSRDRCLRRMRETSKELGLDQIAEEHLGPV